MGPGAPLPSAAAESEVSEDSLLGGRVRLRQPVQGYRAAIDPVLLAAAVSAAAGQSVLDLGCGVGASALCLLARLPDLRVTGLEVQTELVRLAGRNAVLNGLSDRFLPIAGDLRRLPPRLAPGSFHHVMCNPPHLPAGAGRPPRHPGKDRANCEGEVRLADWVGAALFMARAKGTIVFIHRADRLDALLAALAGRAGEAVVFPLWPGADKPAKRVIVRARKDVAAPLTLARGMVLHGPGGHYTAQAEAVLRGGQALAV